MDSYTKMLEYFLENGISLSNDQILALQEKANDNLNIKIGDEFGSEKKDPQMKQINPNTINEFKKLYPSIKKDEGKQGLYFMKAQAENVGDDKVLTILNKMKSEDVEEKLYHSQIYCYIIKEQM